MTAYELVTSKLREVTGYEPRGGKGDWRCPVSAHGDRTASCSVSQGSDRVLLYCHAMCSVEAILGALNLTKADLFDEPPKQASTQSTIDEAYDYTDEQDELLYQVVRRKPKGFAQRRPDGQGGYVWSLGDTRRVLYRLPRVIEAVANNQVVYVVEGEKDVAAVETAGCVATCNPGGVGKWKPEYSAVLRGASVIIVADRDEPGYAHALAVYEQLKGVVARIKVLEPVVGKDVSEHLGAGLTLKQLVPVRKAAPEAEQEEPLGRPFRRILLDLNKVPDPPSLLVQWLYAGCLTILQSEPGVGKSWIALWLMLQVIEAGWSVVYMDEEGGDDLVKERLLALGADPAMVEERVCYYSFEGRQWTPEDLIAFDDVLSEAGAIGRGLGLAVFDSLPDFLAAAGLNEDSAMDVTSFIKKLCDRIRAVGAASLLLDHVPKPPTEGKARLSRYSRGSGAKLAKADATLLLATKDEFDAHRSGLLHLWKTKDRRGRLPLPSLGNNPAELTITVGDGTLAIGDAEVPPPEEPEPWRGPRHCMEEAATFLRERDGMSFSTNQVYEGIRRLLGSGFRKPTVKDALLILEQEEPDITHQTRGNGDYWRADKRLLEPF